MGADVWRGTALRHRVNDEPFIGLLAIAGNPVLQDEVKPSIIGGSVVAALLGAVFFAQRMSLASRMSTCCGASSYSARSEEARF